MSKSETTAARRTDKDYAVEFGAYLATSAERYQAAVNSWRSAFGDFRIYKQKHGLQ